MHEFTETLPSLADNLALDEAFLLQAEAGGNEIVRLWQWPVPAVVLGAAGRCAEDVQEEACAAEQVPILRRSSGGGTVLLGSGCLLYSLVLRYERAPELADLHASYRWIADPLLNALRRHVPGSLALQGSSDLTLDGRKFSGNSQQRKRTHLLHHGTLLYAFDLTAIGRYLRAPPRQPAYRQQRRHEDFLVNLPLAPQEALPRLRQVLQEAWGVKDVQEQWPKDQVQQLVQEKYGRPEWLRRR